MIGASGVKRFLQRNASQVIPALYLVLCAGFARADEPKPSDFAHDVAPILKARCAECHANGTFKGGFSIETRESILKTKAAAPRQERRERTFLNESVRPTPNHACPRKGPPLSAKQIESIKNWIDGGLQWESGFSFKKSAYVPALRPRRPALPAAVAGRDHPIDRIVDSYLAKNSVPPLEPADDVAFVRRAYLDLIGQLPAPAETEAFLKDSDPKKKEKLAATLLADQRAYADHWMSFWNDLLRNEYAGTGYIEGGAQADQCLALPVLGRKQAL